MKNKIEIINLHASVEDVEILKGVNLTVNEGEIHALMGPNGNGKSTLLSVIMGHPDYTITKGDIKVNNESILELPTDERSKLGIFFAMQNPVQIPGVQNLDFLRAIINAHREEPVKLVELYNSVNVETSKLKIDSTMIKRYLNTGFSGGEKKKNEILQMNLLNPWISLIDEIDSGLDVDALNIVSNEINNKIKDNKFSAIIVSHYDRLFKTIKPTHAHVIVDGKIVHSGGIEIVTKINDQGYEWIYQGIDKKGK